MNELLCHVVGLGELPPEIPGYALVAAVNSLALYRPRGWRGRVAIQRVTTELLGDGSVAALLRLGGYHLVTREPWSGMDVFAWWPIYPIVLLGMWVNALNARVKRLAYRAGILPCAPGNILAWSEIWRRGREH